MLENFPQDFPPHLSPLADTQPVYGSAPLGSHPLCFDKMHWAQFEQFCWWLLQRDYDIEGCQLIGGSGREQGGIDLFAYARGVREQLTVFECKCWKDAEPAKLRNTVKRFVNGPWATAGTKFVLILAQDSIAQFDRVWHEVREQLHACGIVAEVWTGMHLTERLRLHPDLLVRFFPDATVNLYCNEWMRRVDFWTKLQQAMVDERPAVRSLAHHFVERISQDDSASGLEQVYSFDNHWNMDTPWVHIDALLPNNDLHSGSIAIVIKKPSTSGLRVAVSQEWLLKNLLARVNSPAEHIYRPFIYGPVSRHKDAEVTIDLNSARLEVPQEGVAAICTALDRLTPIYTDALRKLERQWGAQGCPFIGHSHNTSVAMCAISKWTWQRVLEFACAHDADAGDSEWHIFDANRNYLKVFTRRPHPKFEAGYHAFIHARDDLEGLAYGSDVVLTWQPPASFYDRKMDPRHWMACAEVLAWIRDKLLPAVGHWLIENELRKARPWRNRTQRRELEALWIEKARLWEHREQALVEDEHYRALGLVSVAERLQASIGDGAPQLYLTRPETRALYHALATVMKGGRGYVPYIASNLALNRECRSHQDLVSALLRHADGDTPSPSARMVQNMLSALLEGLNDDSSWLDAQEIETVYTALKPLMLHQDLVELYERHTRWV